MCRGRSWGCGGIGETNSPVSPRSNRSRLGMKENSSSSSVFHSSSHICTLKIQILGWTIVCSVSALILFKKKTCITPHVFFCLRALFQKSRLPKRAETTCMCSPFSSFQNCAKKLPMSFASALCSISLGFQDEYMTNSCVLCSLLSKIKREHLHVCSLPL
jgi:hypothetical protein